MIELLAEARLECTRRGVPAGGRGKTRNRNRGRCVGARGRGEYSTLRREFVSYQLLRFCTTERRRCEGRCSHLVYADMNVVVGFLLVASAQHVAARSCDIASVTQAMAMSVERDATNASAHSAAFIAACKPGRWNLNDALKYHQATWHPGGPTGTSCSNMHLLGGYLEGGRTVCHPTKLFAASPCRIVSVGSNGEASFEAAVLAMAPNCSIDVLDGTLVGPRAYLRKNLPSAVNFVPVNFDSQSASRFNYRHVQALKIDCEACEFEALMPWVHSTCTDQVYLELHTFDCKSQASASCYETILKVHRLMSQMESLYAIYYKEPNVAYGAVHNEYAFIRRAPCIRRRGGGLGVGLGAAGGARGSRLPGWRFRSGNVVVRADTRIGGTG